MAERSKPVYERLGGRAWGRAVGELLEGLRERVEVPEEWWPWGAGAKFAHAMGRAERATAARHIGARVARARRRAGMTQATLASLVSLDRTALSRIESGQRHLRPHELARIAEALGRSVDWFLSGPLPAAQDTMTLLRTRRPAILRTVRRHGGRSVRVFGSVARGEATQESDIDLLVDMEPDRGLLDQAAMIAELTDLLGRPVDVVTPGALRPGVRERVLAEARPL